MADTNGFEGVGWMIGGGAEHSADIGRVLAYIACGGREGVVSPGDWKVTATPGTPDANIHIAIGAGSIINRSPGVVGQAYTERALTVSDKAIAPTGGSARSDLVVIRVKDPQYSPWTPYDPVTQAEQRKNGPYFFPEIISGVPASTTDARSLGLTQSMYAVARIDMPAGQSAVQSSYIKDLRQLIKPNRSEDQLVSAQPANDQRNTSTTPARWITAVSFAVPVPEWATHYIARLDVTNSIHVGPNVFGNLELRLENNLVASNPYASEAPAATSQRIPIQSAITNGVLALPNGYAGTTRTFSLYGSRDGSVTGYLTTDIQTRGILEVTWLQRAV